MDNCILKRRLALWASYACTAMLITGWGLTSSSCKDDQLLTGTPEWLGSSIYEELESRGSFTQTLALINDPELSEYPSLLRTTGSMTLFVADDDAWARFLSKRGVSSVSELSKAEKKNLLKAAMINNAYLIDLLGNKTGNPPTEDVCMRHITRMDYADSIEVLPAAKMPEQAPSRDNYVDHWAAVRDQENIMLLKAYRNSSGASYSDPVPMLYFLPRFMMQNSFTEKDLSILTGGKAVSLDQSFVNGNPIAPNTGRWPSRDVESTGKTKEFLQDITCQNGYIHVVSEVPEQLNNMAEVIASKPQFSIFSKLLDRFSYPQIISYVEYPDGTVDYLYSKRYFNSSLNHGLGDYIGTSGATVTVDDKLSIDPGWNSYIIYTASNQYGIEEDAAAMFVPNDEQMQNYLTSSSGGGKDIGDKYGQNWDNVPDNLVAPFINNCIQKSFRATIPSKLAAMKNTAAEPMGITIDNIKNAYLACNGVVYEVGSVFAAPEHESVLFPALLRADETGDMKISNKLLTYDPTGLNTNLSDEATIRGAWKLHEFKAYLNSMSSIYSFLLPTDDAFGYPAMAPEKVYYIDPYSFVDKQKPQAFVFTLNPKSKEPVQATAYLLDEEGNVTETKAARAAQPNITVVANRLYDIIDNSIVVHGQRDGKTKSFTPGQTVYQTKTGSPVSVTYSGSSVATIAGSKQMNENTSTPITQSYDKTAHGNGVTYIMSQLPQTTIITPDSMLNDVLHHPEYTAFSRLLKASSFYSKSNTMDGHVAIGHPITLFANYHYTVYVPQNDLIDQLVAEGKLPSDQLINDYEKLMEALENYDPAEDMQTTYDEKVAEVKELQDKIQNIIDEFIRLHIQDGSIFIGGEQITNVLHETSSVDLEMSRFRTLSVTNTGTDISLTRTYKDMSGAEQTLTANVIPGDDSNKVSRQYLFNSSDKTIFSSSYVVNHLIDKVLLYDEKEQFLPSTFPNADDVWPDWLPKGGDVKKYAKRNRR